MKKSAGLAIVYNGMILLGHTTGRGWYGSYSIPKGGIEKDETHIDAAIRETFEEIGVKVPKKLINPTEHTFVVTSRNKDHNKIVYYFIVEIEDLNQIGLTDIKISKSKLQVDEIDWAGFLTYNEAIKRIMKSQISLINNLVNRGLIESNIFKYEQFTKKYKL